MKTPKFHANKRFYYDLKPVKTDRFGQKIEKVHDKPNHAQKTIRQLALPPLLTHFVVAEFLHKAGSYETADKAITAILKIKNRNKKTNKKPPYNPNFPTLTIQENEHLHFLYTISRNQYRATLQQRALNPEDRTIANQLKIVAEIDKLISQENSTGEEDSKPQLIVITQKEQENVTSKIDSTSVKVLPLQ